MGIILFGHRGSAGEAPENTLGGFAYARQIGVRAFELDIHLSKDNELVVIHDATLERTTDGSGAVHDYTAAELKSLNAARLFPNWASREGVPSLQEVLSRYHATIDHWQLEIKQDSEQNLAVVCALLARQIHHYHLDERVTVTSFHPPALQSMHSVDARLRLGLIRSPIEIEDISLARSLNCLELCVPLQTGSQSLVSLAHSAGLRVTGWLGNDAPGLDRLLAWGVDAITSDVPSFAAQYVADVSSRRFSAMDIPRIFNITESAHRIHNPFTPEKLATLGAALRLESGTRVLDLGSGSGEMLCTWARDHGVIGTGIDKSQLFTEQAKLRAEELGVADQVKFIHGDASGYVSDEKASVAACVGATWIAGGVAGTIELLAQSLRPGGIILIGEPYWRQLPPTEDVARGCLAGSISDFLLLPELLASFGHLGYDVVEMVLADQDSWDRYEAAKWLTLRRWLEANPADEFAKDVRAKLTSEPERYAAYTREYLGWGVFALMPR